MSSKSQSERSSNTSSPVPRPPPRSLIVSKVHPAKDETWLFNDLSQNYDGILKVSRNSDSDGNAFNSIRVDFDSEEVVGEILDQDVIYINNREHFIRPYWPLICYRCGYEGHRSAECPHLSIPQWRLAQLIEDQKNSFEQLINDFENRWTDRLSKMENHPSADHSQLTPIATRLTNVCQQMNQQNVQIQQQLNALVNRLQTI